MTHDTEHVTNFAARIRAEERKPPHLRSLPYIAVGMIEATRRVLKNPETGEAFMDAIYVRQTYAREFGE